MRESKRGKIETHSNQFHHPGLTGRWGVDVSGESI